jgi:hypothetical protein
VERIPTADVLQRLPEARTETVSDLVTYAQQGKIRIPTFQRPLNWESRNVVELFDSIYRGLPIGSLLLWKQKAEAARIHLGPLEVVAPEVAEAWWVVDGQQRITSLAASLLRPLPIPVAPAIEDPFVVYFDASALRFEPPRKSGEVPADWVPLPALLDAARLSEWVHDWSLGSDRERRQRVFEAGKRIREYKLPLYLVETTNAELLRQIFYRVNNSGKPLKWSEVHDALYGHDVQSPSTTVQLARELASLGMGRLDKRTITTCLFALRGLDVTRPLSEHQQRDPDVLRGAVADALPVLRQVLAFLQTKASIPHLRLLPRMMVLEVLTRFFVLHPEPRTRTKTLLVRWIWRTLLGDWHLDERTFERRAIAAVTDNEESSVQQMLKLAPVTRPTIELADAFDARTAGSRLALLALASLSPRDLRDERPIAVPNLIETRETDAFAFIVRKQSVDGVHGPENRLLHENVPSLRSVLVERIAKRGVDDPVLRSHGIDPDAAHILEQDIGGFLKKRRRRIQQTLEDLGDRLAEWGRDNDRPTLDYLLSDEEQFPRAP